MYKRGQFFIVAALVIVILIVGSATIYNSVRINKEDESVKDLSSEVNYESAQVIDQGIFNSFSQDAIAENLQNLSTIYSKSNPDSDLLIVYGDKSQAKVLLYNVTDVGSIGLGTGGAVLTLAQVNSLNLQIGTATPEQTGELTLKIKDVLYDFNINPGQNFFIVIKKDKNDEQIVAKK